MTKVRGTRIREKIKGEKFKTEKLASTHLISFCNLEGKKKKALASRSLVGCAGPPATGLGWDNPLQPPAVNVSLRSPFEPSELWSPHL